MTLLSLLDAGRKNPFVIQDDQPFSREDVLRDIEGLRTTLRAHQRVMVASSEARTVFSTIAACQALAIPVWIGHEFSGSAALDEISRSQRVEVRVGNNLKIALFGNQQAAPDKGGFAVHIMTSGTTGTPKIARHTIEALMGRVQSSQMFSGTWLLTYSPSTFAGIQVLLTTVSSHSTLVAYRSATVSVMAKALSQYEITHASATPTFWRAALMALPDSSELPALHQITIGGEIVDQLLLDRLVKRFRHTRITHIYASTEAGALFSVKDGRAGFPAAWLSAKIDGVAMRVRNGLLEVQSPRSMRHYASADTNPYTEDGWLRTGDRVEVVGDRVHFCGRSDHIVNIGGAKVVPEEVEKVVLGVEGVADACVIGARNPITGFVLKVEVVAAPGFNQELLRKEIAQHCHSVLPAHMVPRIIVFVPQLGMSATGKKTGGTA